MPQRHQSMSTLLTLVLVCAFALCALFVVLFGAQIYKNVVATSQDNQTLRTAVQYIAQKVRHHDAMDAVSLTSLEGTPALALKQGQGEDTQLTYLYLYEDALYELTVLEGAGIGPAFGQRLLPLSSLSFSLTGSQLSFSLADAQGAKTGLTLHLRSGGEH